MQLNINNKIKQFFGGYWGSSKFTKRNTEIPKDFFDDKQKRHSKNKRKKKNKKKFVFSWGACPFCGQELEDKPADQYEEYETWRIHVFADKVDFCKCGALKVKDCPACRRGTWYNPKTEIYKHQKMGCGFEGKRLIRNKNNDS